MNSEKNSSPARKRRRRGGVDLRVLKKTISMAEAVAPSLAATIAEKVFFHPRRFEIPGYEKNWTRGCYRTEVKIGKDQRVKVLAKGSGPNVYLVHGWAGRASQMGAFIQPVVEAGYTVIAVDMPAHGRSEGYFVSAPDFVEVIYSLIAKFGPAHSVIAHSMGGWAALKAELLGARIDSIVLIGSPLNPGKYAETFGRIFSLKPQTIQLLIEKAERRTGVNWENISVESQLASVNARGLIIHDLNDLDVSYENAKILEHQWKGAEMLTTSGLGHTRILRDEGIISKVVSFLEEPFRKSRSELAVI